MREQSKPFIKNTRSVLCKEDWRRGRGNRDPVIIRTEEATALTVLANFTDEPLPNWWLFLKIKIVKCLRRWCCLAGRESEPTASLRSSRIWEKIKWIVVLHWECFSKLFSMNKSLRTPWEGVLPCHQKCLSFSSRDFGCVLVHSLFQQENYAVLTGWNLSVR